MLGDVKVDDRVNFYNVIGEAALIEGETVSLHIKNLSKIRNLVIHSIVFQLAGNKAEIGFVNDKNYFQVVLNREYGSGGELVKPINLDMTSPDKASVVCYEANPIISDSDKLVDRWYIQDMNMKKIDTNIILGEGDTVGMSLVGHHNSGKLYTRVSFEMVNND